MILVTVGTHFQPFNRLVKAADEYAAITGSEVLIQTGVATYECKHAKSFNYCQREEMSRLMSEAKVIVMQGGWGAMLQCIEKGYRVVAVPRIEGVEHVHDQEQVVRKLDSLGCVIGVYDIKDLPTAIEKAKYYDFKPLEKGNANIIVETLEHWFPK